MESVGQGEHFTAKNPGGYKIVLWPKIYHKSGTNADVLLRIDLPPVEATFSMEPVVDE